MLETKPAYRDFCLSEKSVSLFCRDWWLDATCGKNGWDVAVLFQDTQIQSALPYVMKRRFGLPFLGMPPLTPQLGPWIRPSESERDANRLSHEHRALEELISKIPKSIFFQMDFSPTLTNWLPFYWKGFKETTRYTYILDVTDLIRTHENLKKNMRNTLEKALSLVSARETDLESFYRNYSRTFAKQNLEPPISIENLRRIDEALLKQGRRAIFGAYDQSSNLHAALYLVWDDTKSYVLMMGSDPEQHQSGANIRLLWEAAQYTNQTLKLQNMDFVGSMMENLEPLRRGFGAKQTPYFRIWRWSI